ncbi:SGNH/GDSL hydrolase family protein [Dyadobacter psychrotolerans]|uniref:SGNH/GDSL hydrolase family protein n=1 Tax=Dyadobacter psychrotolerans TaxID=2541721 RepID=UPI001405119C|nr:SGNH/GDSL hydrolase family protein [Dyadobacter psychrotolerans]
MTLLSLHGQSFAQKQTGAVFANGDKVCFVGNSITNNGQFYNFVNLYYATRYPDRKVTFINCGISGDVTQGILNRMESDILVHKPNWCVLMIGMNDVSRSLYSKARANEAGIEEKKQQALDLYNRNLEIIVKKLLEGGRKLILQKPSIYDQTGTQATENMFGVNDALKKCADFGQQLADKYNLVTVDYWTILTNINKTVQQKDSAATIIGPDRVHPGPEGHLVMAYEFLRSTGAEKYVSKIVIARDEQKSNKESLNCQIKDISVKKGEIQFSVKENSLPFPVDASAGKALDLVNFTSDFNQQILKIENVSPGSYQLLIDGSQIGSFSSGQLKEGINLAVFKDTPQYHQALKIMALLAEYRKNQSMYRNIVTIQIHHLPDSLKDADRSAQQVFLEKRLEEKFKTSPQLTYYTNQFKSYLANKSKQQQIMQAMPEIIEKVFAANQPVVHRFRLVSTP